MRATRCEAAPSSTRADTRPAQEMDDYPWLCAICGQPVEDVPEMCDCQPTVTASTEQHSH